MEKSENPPPYSHPQPDTQTVIVIDPVTVGPSPVSITCPWCHAEIVTTVISIATTKTHMFALLLCLLGGLICCWIPYCMDSCQARSHYCPNCKKYIGKYEN